MRSVLVVLSILLFSPLILPYILCLTLLYIYHTR
jgi:hypothetical protein